MKQWIGMVLVGLWLWPGGAVANELFKEMAKTFAEDTVKDFVTFVAKNERYPLLHVVTKTRFRVLKAYLKIKKPRDTKVCSRRRNAGTEVPEKQLPFCDRYDQTIDAAKAGLAHLEHFEKVYFKLEPMLLREIERQQAREPMQKWIRSKVKCFDAKTRCGRDERGMLGRVTQWEPNILRLYKHVLENLEKKLFPEESTLTFLDESGIDSPCSSSGKVRNMITDHGMVFIPEGAFLMGNNEGRPDEQKAHATQLDAFWIDRCEVTNLDYLKYLVKDPYLRKSTLPRKFHDGDYLKDWTGDLKPPKNRDNFPVVYVSWFAARYYCQSIGKRLPSEAEWEKSARGGFFTEYSFDNNVSELTDYAWYNVNAEGYIRLVADKLPNKFEIYDMHGNAWEWVYDWYAPYPEGRVENPQGPSRGKYRVIRGGSWKSPAYHLRSSMRGDDSPVNTSEDVGFRCAASTHPSGGRLKE